MHGAGGISEGLAGFLGGYYLILAIMNAVAAYYLWHQKHQIGAALGCILFTALLVILSPFALSGSPPVIPMVIRKAVDAATGPVIYSVGTTGILLLLFV